MIEITDFLTRIVLSSLLGLFVGYERSQQHKPAGMRDVAIVSLGATIFTVIALEIANIMPENDQIRYDIGRIMAYLIASIGFLCSGVIIQNKNKLEGITTASVLWTIVSVGVLCGLGKYGLASISAIAIYALLKFKHIQIKFETTKKKKRSKK